MRNCDSCAIRVVLYVKLRMACPADPRSIRKHPMSARRALLSCGLAGSILALAVACSEPTVPEALVTLDASQLSVKGRLPKPAPDTETPTVPVFAVTAVGPTHITLAWSSTDASAPILYSVSRDGGTSSWTFDTFGTFKGLQPTATYTFTAKARDNAGNWSAVSAPFSVTTTAIDPNDVTPPTTPTNVGANLYDDGSREMQVNWTGSTDNVTPQSVIVYHIYVNGVLENSSIGVPQTSGYGVAGDNVITVIAVDAAGNRSAAGTARLFITF
jgi:chitodextrinase